jgi:small-conductance mechanosensitive channel/predicted  nucleic acid-binding Zn-ribbon protein
MYKIPILGMFLVFSLCAMPAHSQPNILQQTLMSSKTVKDSPTADQPLYDTDASRIRTLLKEARAEFNKVDSPGGLSAGAPPATTGYELVRRRFLLRLIVTNYERLLSELHRAEILHGKQALPDKNVLAGISDAEKPPYSILLVERVQERLQSAQFKVKQAEIALESSAARESTTEDNLKKLEGKKRAILEQIEKESDSAKVAVLEWSSVLIDLNLTLLSTERSVLQVVQKNSEAELAIFRKELAALGDKLDELSKNARFTESDLNEIIKRLEERRFGFERDLERALTEKESAQNVAEKRLTGLLTHSETRHNGNGDKRLGATLNGDQLSSLIVQAKLENSNLKVDLYRDMLEFNRFEILVWELRYAAEVLKDKESVARINRMIPRALTGFDKQVAEDSLNLNMLILKLNEVESELAQSVPSESRENLKRLHGIYTATEELLLSRIKVSTAAKNVFVRLSSHYSEGTKNAISKAKVTNWKNIATGVWNYELFATDDVYTVDGKEIKGKRGVTIAKVVSALALLVIGWIVSSKCTRMFFHHAVKRYDMPEGGALLARRWSLALIFVILLLTSLHLVRIPLTAFAFLGGAIVIGVGFGIQDLMKNLISGLMMLTERPFRIGDLIDVGGVRGRVTSIGIRSSTIRDVTGIETLVPNSTFVEKNVTNWTYSTQQVRYTVSVGVAYGSNITLVNEQLLQAATRHGVVLKKPEPVVTLDDFGTDALIFGLYYWLKLDSTADPRIISSDLRIMIEKLLHAEGITISFPQRDIHIDSVKPLRVEIVEEAQSVVTSS